MQIFRVKGKINYLLLLGCTMVTFGVGLLGLYVIGDFKMMYYGIVKPFGTPSEIVFIMAWLFTHVLMGTAIYRVISSFDNDDDLAVSLFAVQLFLSFLWCILFFGYALNVFALIELTILLMVICLVIDVFREIDKIAAMMFIPSLIWYLIVFYLNFGIFLLN